MQDIPNNLGHQLTTRVKLLQKVAVFNQGAVLLLKREPQSKSRPGSWDLPGGNSEWPQDLQDSRFGLHRDDAVRELREETGIIVMPELLTFQTLRYIETFFDVEKQVYSIIFGWHIELPDGVSPSEVRLSDEHTEFEWAKTSEIDAYDFDEHKGQFVKDIIRGKGQIV